MRPTLLYRIAAGLLVLFAAGHQLGFRQVDPAWHADAVVAGMHLLHFSVQGFSRSYWDFFSGFGFFVTAFLLLSAVLSWELGRTQGEVLVALRRVRWAFALTYVAIAVMTWMYFFVAPGIFSLAVALCLLLAARTPKTA